MDLMGDAKPQNNQHDYTDCVRDIEAIELAHCYSHSNQIWRGSVDTDCNDDNNFGASKLTRRGNPDQSPREGLFL
jgi:hypothetical protein